MPELPAPEPPPAAESLLALRHAADQAHAAYDYETAIAHYGQALALLAATPGSPDAATEYDLRSGRAYCYHTTGAFLAEQSDLQAMAGLAARLGDLKRRIAVVTRQWNLDTFGQGYAGLNAYVLACEVLDARHDLVHTIDDRSPEAFTWLELGRVVLEHGQVDAARALFQLVEHTCSTRDQPAMQATTRAWLGAAHLALGDIAAAQAYTAQAAMLLAPVVRTDFPPQEVWWWRYQALAAAPHSAALARTRGEGRQGHDPAHHPVWERRPGDAGDLDDPWFCLGRAHETMLAGIANLSDAGLRRNYLNKVAINRAIVETWSRLAERRGRAPRPAATVGQARSLQDQLTRMLDISGRMNQRRDINTLLDFIMDELIELSGAERAFLAFQPASAAQEPAQRQLDSAGQVSDEVVVTRGIAPDTLPEIRRQAADLLELLARSRQPALWQDVSAVGIPLTAGGRQIGLLYADIRTIFGRFEQADVDLLTMLATQATTAIVNAQLYDATMRANRELEQRVAERATELEIIHGIGQLLTNQLDLRVVIDLVGDKIREVLRPDAIGIVLYDPQADLLHVRYAYELGLRQPEVSAALGKGLSSRIIQSRRPLLLGTLRQILELSPNILKNDPDDPDIETYLGVPIVVGDEVIGVLDIQSYQQHAYRETDVRLLTTIAATMGVALQNTRLHQQTQRRATEMAALAAIGQDIANTSDLDTVLERIAAQAKNLLHVHEIALYLWQPEEQVFRARVALGRYVDETKADPLRLGEGVIGSIAQSGVAELVNDLERDPRSRQIPGTPDDGTEYLMCAPLVARASVIGLIVVWRMPAEGLFEATDLNFLVSLARQAEIAIENARLFLETRRRATQMAALAEVGRDISATLDLPTVLERIAAHAQELLAADTSAVYLPQPGGRSLRAITVLGADADAICDDIIPLGRGIVGDLARRGVAEMIHDTSADPRARQIPGTPQLDTEQLMATPLLAGAKVIGMMAVWRSGQRALFTEADLDFLVSLARQAAIALENARLFEEAEQARAQAEAARSAAEAANIAKSTFLANMSHELRTPLNAVLGFAQLMERDPALASRQKEHLGIISRSGEHLLGLINDVLEVSKIEAGRVTLNEAPFDLHALLRNVEELFQLRAETKHLRLRFEIALDLPQHVAGDESKVRQVLINLLGNAVKFTHSGGITLRAGWRDHRTENREPRIEDRRSRIEDGEPPPSPHHSPSAVVEVEDSGVGIAADQLPSLFQPFVQTTSGLQAHEGSGLGLAITRQFVQLMGGDITVTSVVGQGTTFTFDIRLTPAAPSQILPLAERHVVGIAPESQGEYRMLVVDDKWENRRLLVEWLSGAGFAVREASNGQEAIAEWERWEPHMIWMDMRMPVLDGYAATRQIKASLKGQATVIVALTASAFEHEQAIVLSAGCDDFVRKPVREALVFEKIAQHLGIQFVYAEPAVGAAPGGVAPLRSALAALPSDWSAMLRQAIQTADMEQVKALAGQIRARDAALADGLDQLADDLRLDQLYALIQT